MVEQFDLGTEGGKTCLIGNCLQALSMASASIRRQRSKSTQVSQHAEGKRQVEGQTNLLHAQTIFVPLTCVHTTRHRQSPPILRTYTRAGWRGTLPMLPMILIRMMCSTLTLLTLHMEPRVPGCDTNLGLFCAQTRCKGTFSLNVHTCSPEHLLGRLSTLNHALVLTTTLTVPEGCSSA